MKIRSLIVILYLFASLWFVFGIAWFFRNSTYGYFYSTVGLACSIIITLLAYFVGKRQMWAWWATTLLVAVSIVVSIFDEVGWIDLVYITTASLLFIVLLKKRSLMKNNK